MENISISTDRERLNITAIHHFLSTAAYWSNGIPLATVETAVANSLNFGVYDDERQVGFARVVSDFSTVAYLADVFIIPEYRGKGLSKMLMHTIMNHPQLQGLRRWLLGTLDAHGLYKQFGWTSIANPERWMELHNKNVYTL
jgi:GNAT superfamily N-acetyltransferase